METLTDGNSKKEMVKEKYAQIALQDRSENASSCCGAGGCSTDAYTIFNEDYTGLKGYNPDADLALGCGIPVKYAGIQEGDTVVDLGSGAGNDVFVARSLVGNDGRVIGIDMTEVMIEKAKKNNEKLGYSNVEFRLGDIEKMPVGPNRADVVVSNCVLNLVPDKEKAFSEIHRVLKPGGHFCISDIVMSGILPEKIQNAAEMYAGCISGAMQKKDYLAVIHSAGFQNVSIRTEKEIKVPDDILLNYLSADELKNLKESGVKIESITVTAEKAKSECCSSSGCC